MSDREWEDNIVDIFGCMMVVLNWTEFGLLTHVLYTFKCAK